MLTRCDFEPIFSICHLLTITFFNKKESSITIHNGSEKILLETITFKGDSVVIPFNIFNSEIRIKIEKVNDMIKAI